jgi:hypothetical protein
LTSSTWWLYFDIIWRHLAVGYAGHLKNRMDTGKCAVILPQVAIVSMHGAIAPGEHDAGKSAQTD